MTNRKAAAGAIRHGSVSNLNLTFDGKFNGFDALNYKKSAFLNQCVKCGSDYMKFAVNGFCQDCQQRCEFIMRERPHIAHEIKNQRRGETI